jgi:hypothetical protein
VIGLNIVSVLLWAKLASASEGWNDAGFLGTRKIKMCAEKALPKNFFLVLHKIKFCSTFLEPAAK